MLAHPPNSARLRGFSITALAGHVLHEPAYVAIRPLPIVFSSPRGKARAFVDVVAAVHDGQPFGLHVLKDAIEKAALDD